MLELTPHLQEKFEKFRNSYEWAIVWLADAGGNSERKISDAFQSAMRDVPLDEVEVSLFQRLLREEAAEVKPMTSRNHLPPIPPPTETEF